MTIHLARCVHHRGIVSAKRLTKCPVCKAFVSRGALSDLSAPVARAVTRQRAREKAERDKAASRRRRKDNGRAPEPEYETGPETDGWSKVHAAIHAVMRKEQVK